MIEFDAEYSIIAHFEINEEQALDQGGVNIEALKKNCILFSDWILGAIAENIEVGDNDTVTVLPVEMKLTVNGKNIVLDKTPEDYKTILADGSEVDFKQEIITTPEPEVNNDVIEDTENKEGDKPTDENGV